MTSPGRTRAAARAGGTALCAMLAVCAATVAAAQSLVCCNAAVAVGGSWIGTNRVTDCQEYFNSAPTATLRRLCEHRTALSCINTARCSTLPPDETAQEPASDGPAPPDLDRDGLEQGFYGAPPAEPPRPPAAAPPPRRLVYIVTLDRRGDTPSKSFMAWLDRDDCPLALDANNRLADAAAATHVVRGTVIRRDGRVQIKAEAQQRPGGAKLGPFTAEAVGEDAAAVASATRAVLEQMKLACSR